MLKLKKSIILFVVLGLLFTSGNVFAAGISLGEDIINLPQGWKTVTQENKEEAFKNYPYLKEIKDFVLIYIKDGNIEAFNKAQKEQNGEDILNNYPAYIVVKSMELKQSNRKEMVEKPVNQLKKSVNATYENATFVREEEISVGENPGKRIDYEVGRMTFKNMFYADEDHFTGFLATSTKVQEASEEIEQFYSDILKVYNK